MCLSTHIGNAFKSSLKFRRYIQDYKHRNMVHAKEISRGKHYLQASISSKEKRFFYGAK